MNNLPSLPTRIFSLLIAAVLVAAPSLVSAQDDGPFMASARVIDVISGKEGHVAAALADVSEAYEAAGRDLRVVYERVRGDLPAFVVFTVDEAFNDVPPVNVDAQLISRITENSNGNTYLSLAFNPALATNVAGAARTEYMVARIYSVSPANYDAFEDFLSETVAPALEEAGIMSRTARIIAGGNLGIYITFAYSDSFPTGNTQALIQSMGQRDYDRMVEQATSLLGGVEDLLYRYRPDLSVTGN